jgi:hypothetical protein
MPDAGQGEFDPQVQQAPEYEFDQRIVCSRLFKKKMSDLLARMTRVSAETHKIVEIMRQVLR